MKDKRILATLPLTTIFTVPLILSAIIFTALALISWLAVHLPALLLSVVFSAYLRLLTAEERHYSIPGSICRIDYSNRALSFPGV